MKGDFRKGGNFVLLLIHRKANLIKIKGGPDMKKGSFFLKLIVFICVFSILPVTAVMGANTSEKINTGTTTKITEITKQNSSKQNTISPLATNPGEGGTTTIRCYNLNGNMMDADWTLVSTTQPITYVNVNVLFSDGYSKHFNYHPFGMTVYNSAQHTFSSSGYKTATVSGWGYKDFGLIQFWLVPTTDGTVVTNF